MRKVLKEIFWYALSLAGAFIFVAFVAPAEPDKAVQALGFPVIATAGFILSAAAAQQTTMGKRIINDKDHGNK